MKDLYEKVRLNESDYNYVSLEGRQTIDADTLTMNQNRNKNHYVKMICDMIVGKQLGEQELYCGLISSMEVKNIF